MPRRRLTADEALLALIILAMEIDENAAAVEAAQAEALIHRLPRFKRLSRAAVGRLIERMRTFVRDHDDAEVVGAACRAIPASARGGALAVLATMAMSDRRLTRSENALVWRVADTWGLSRRDAAAAIASSSS